MESLACGVTHVISKLLAEPFKSWSREVLFGPDFASFKAILIFLMTKTVDVPPWTPFWNVFVLPSKQYCKFGGPKIDQIRGGRTDGRTNRRTQKI